MTFNVDPEVKEGKEGKKEEAADLIVPEERLPGKIAFRDYINLFSFGPGGFGFFLFFFVCLLTALAQLGTSFTLSNWTSQTLEEQQKSFYPGMFCGSVFLYISFCLLRGLVCFWLFLSSTTNLHNTVCERVLRAEILFFDSNPIGRIVTRFSKDVAVLDFMIPVFAIFIASGVFRTITVAITVGIINPYLFIVVVVAFLLMMGILKRG